MVCINRRSSGIKVWLFACGDCHISAQVGRHILDDLPTEYYEYDGSNFDPNDGLHSTQTRHYDTTEGRWLSEDPIAYQPNDDATSRSPGNAPG
jgi:RHS repeat-associated protein